MHMHMHMHMHTRTRTHTHTHTQHKPTPWAVAVMQNCAAMGWRRPCTPTTAKIGPLTCV